MIDKIQLLNDVRMAAIQGLVSFDELTHAFQGAAPGTQKPAPTRRAIGVTEMLYFLGGAVVFIGIVVLLQQHWTKLSFLTRVIATLGSGLAAYYAGLLLSRQERYAMAAQAFFLISALALPVGLGILFDHAGFDTYKVGVQAAISGILFTFFVLSYAIFRSQVFLLFSVLYGTWLFFSATGTLFNGSPDVRIWKVTEYRFLITGLTYMLMGYAFSEDDRSALTGPLYAFGVMLFLGAAYCLGGWKPTQNGFWEFLFPCLTMGVLFLSVFLKSKSFLTFGSIFLIGYIGKITVEYFKDSLGWPLSLVLIGFGLMGIGFVALRLNSKYLKV